VSLRRVSGLGSRENNIASLFFAGVFAGVIIVLALQLWKTPSGGYVWWEWLTERPWYDLRYTVLKYGLVFFTGALGIAWLLSIATLLDSKGGMQPRRGNSAVAVGVVGFVIIGAYSFRIYYDVTEGFWFPWAVVVGLYVAITWYHLREPGTLGGLSGFLIGSLVFFVFGAVLVLDHYAGWIDWPRWITDGWGFLRNW